MSKPNLDLEDIANKVGLTPEDLETIKKTKRKNITHLSAVEILIGFVSFLYGYSLTPVTEKLGYPFLPILLAGNISISSQIKKKKPFILIIFLTLLTSLVGVASGFTIGTILKSTYITTVNGSTIKYGVYSEVVNV